MKALTITCHNVYNHGASLQAWALVTYLRGLKIDAQIIDYQPEYLRGHYDLIVRNDRYNHPIIKHIYILAKYPGWRRSLKRKHAFDAFSDYYLKPMMYPDKYLRYDELLSNPPIADVYIAGSDQIWNTRFENGKDPAFYLHFGMNGTRRISYAASFATDQLYDGTQEFVTKELLRFDEISVREASALNILHSLNLEGFHVVDPVFLLDSNEWLSKIKRPLLKLPVKPYILVYNTYKSKKLPIIISRLKKLTGADIYSVNGSNVEDTDTTYKNVGPDGFLHLIANASLVVSDSFHATAFSIIFKRNFFVVDRCDGLNRRMRDLLISLNLETRFITPMTSDDILNSDIEYESVYRIMSAHIQQSKDWLKQAINKS